MSFWSKVERSLFSYADFMTEEVQKPIIKATNSATAGVRHAVYDYQETMDNFVAGIMGEESGDDLSGWQRAGAAPIVGLAAAFAPITALLGLGGCSHDPSSDLNESDAIGGGDVESVDGSVDTTEIGGDDAIGGDDSQSPDAGGDASQTEACVFARADQFNISSGSKWMQGQTVWGWSGNEITACSESGCESIPVVANDCDPNPNVTSVNFADDHIFVGTQTSAMIMDQSGNVLTCDILLNFVTGGNTCSMSNYSSGISVGSATFAAGDVDGHSEAYFGIMKIDSDKIFLPTEAKAIEMKEVNGKIVVLFDDGNVGIMDSQTMNMDLVDANASSRLIVDGGQVAVKSGDQQITIITISSGATQQANFMQTIKDFDMVDGIITALTNSGIILLDTSYETTQSCTLDPTVSGALMIFDDGSQMHILTSSKAYIYE